MKGRMRRRGAGHGDTSLVDQEDGLPTPTGHAAG